MKHALSGLSLLLSFFISAQAFAQQTAAVKPYSFSGTCSSQGLWTQEALQTTQQLRSFTMQLRDDPNCRALGTQMQAALSNVEELVKPQLSEKYSHRLTELPQEIGAFRQFLSGGDTAFKAPVESTMFQKAVEQATLTASVQSQAAGGMSSEVGGAVGEVFGGPVGAAIGATVAGQSSAIGGQFAKSSRQGLLIFNQVIDSVPAMEQCLTGSNVAAGQFLAGTVKLLTSFAASGQDTTGSSLATAISKLTDMMRMKKFADVLTKTNQADFLASMSCLVEMTSENYCTTRDSQLLYNEMVKQLNAHPPDQELKHIGLSSPLAGYYILTQNLPMITSWIQRVQIGVDPRLPTDASFQNKIFDEVNNFYKQIKTIKGNLSYDIEAMKSIQDNIGRKNQARTIISKLTGLLGGSQSFDSGNDGTSASKNFFMLGGSSRELPFKLMGIPMPPEVLGAASGTSMDPDTWLQNNYSTNPAFADPLVLIDRVQKNLDAMIEAASRNAVAYYNQFFIIDKLSLVNDSFLGTNYSVYDSLVLVNQYLEQVESRIRASGADLSMLASVQDTRTRIRNVLATYEDLKALSASLKAGNDHLSEDELRTVEEVNVKIVTSVYDEFQVMLGKSGWFANRVVKFVYADYLIQIKVQHDFGSSINDLFYATGLSIFDQLVASASGNPAKVQNDLSLALRLNKMNLEGVESLVGDYFSATTANMKAVAKKSAGRPISLEQTRASISLWDRVYREQSALLPGTHEPALNRITRGVLASVWESVLDIPSVVPFERYASFAKARYTYNYQSTAVDDEFGSARRLYEQFCIQSLAFSDVRAFYALCRGTTLKSPFETTLLADLTPEQRDELSVSYDKKLVESSDNAELNASKRICAFRDYNRKNLVMYLTRAQQKN